MVNGTTRSCQRARKSSHVILTRRLSAALLLRHSLGLTREAAAVEAAVDAVLAGGARSADLGGKLGSREMADAVLGQLAAVAGVPA